MLSKQELTDRELLFSSIIVSLVLCYIVAVLLLLKLLGAGGWETAAAGFVALMGPLGMSQLLYRWTVS